MSEYSMGRMNDLMQVVHICEKFGWTWAEYWAQPVHFIRLIKEKMIRDHKAEEQASRKYRGK